MKGRRSSLAALGIAAIAVAAVFLLGGTASSGQATDVTPPDWLDKITANAQTLTMTDPVSSAEELPGLGHKFELFGAMVRDTDPENAAGNSGGSGGGVGGNEAISDVMTPTNFAIAYRNLPPGIKITALTNQIGFKYFFANRSCGGGSPRITLLVDANGDGQFVQAPQGPDFAAQGHVNPPLYNACPPNMWMYENMTDKAPRWEITPCTTGTPPMPILPAPFTCPFPFNNWQTLVTAVTTAFPFHRILAGFLVEDSCSFAPDTCGKAYYDLLTIENRTLEIWQDTVQH